MSTPAFTDGERAPVILDGSIAQRSGALRDRRFAGARE
jgi:hypothetical protein